ncbi:DUF4373 domain-containing protein [Clostridium tyrobutyricum]|uniref:DUF4373 domain-containing protein n=1 Tax=Clostridium tyrobutyricum TaxID=1519 RepID=UPI001C386B94|nr:DUF4373 domain-containing protein [Clostridium tyrobutyricum]MBV4426467.1 DUF4373 domain-containing protein [Clostridium tyrobutyricum]
MKETYYFSHDYNARNDPKILAMRSKYGAEGYGWYWMIIEILREQPEYKLESNKYLCITLAMQLQCDSNALHEFVQNCINEYELFEADDRYFWSNSLLRRMSKKSSKSESARKAANARWHKGSNPSKSNKKNTENNADNANAMHEQCERNAIKESKVKENKRNTIIKKENKEKEPWVTVLEYFCQKSGKLDSQLKFRELESAQKICSEVPTLSVVLQGIDQAFKQFKPDTENDKINSFCYCVGPIKKLWKYEKSKKDGGSKHASTGQNTESSPYDFSRFGG